MRGKEASLSVASKGQLKRDEGSCDTAELLFLRHIFAAAEVCYVVFGLHIVIFASLAGCVWLPCRVCTLEHRHLLIIEFTSVLSRKQPWVKSKISEILKWIFYHNPYWLEIVSYQNSMTGIHYIQDWSLLESIWNRTRRNDPTTQNKGRLEGPSERDDP